MKKEKRSNKILIGLTEREALDLDVIMHLDGYSTKSETIRHLIHKRKQEMYCDETKELFQHHKADA
jgi:hypothetical protein